MILNVSSKEPMKMNRNTEHILKREKEEFLICVYTNPPGGVWAKNSKVVSTSIAKSFFEKNKNQSHFKKSLLKWIEIQNTF